MKLTDRQVRDIAELANLRLGEQEVESMAHDLGDILTYIEKLSELDTSGVEPMAQVLFEADETATLREDAEAPSLSNAEALGNSAMSGGGYFKVPKVIER